MERGHVCEKGVTQRLVTCAREIRWMQRCSGEIAHLREGGVSVILSAAGGG